jgi:hypothetical protein
MPLYAIKYKIGDVVQTVLSVAGNEAMALADSQIVVDACCPNDKCVPVETQEVVEGTVIVYYQAAFAQPKSQENKSRIILTGHLDKVQ